jgi:hypothetical protein
LSTNADHLNSSSEGLQNIQASTDETALRTQKTLRGVQNIDNTLTELVLYVKAHSARCLPSQPDYNWAGGLSAANQPIILLNARHHTRGIPISREFYMEFAVNDFPVQRKVQNQRTRDIRDLLAILFRNHPGHSKVIKEEYELEDSRGAVALGNSNWNIIAVPGAIITMRV